MERKAAFQAAVLAAIVAFVCAILLGFVFRAPDPGVSLQPVTPGPVTEFVRPINDYPELMLRFLASDTLFVLSYLVVFAGLYATVADRARVVAIIGLGAGVLTALFDATENAYFVTYAAASLNGVPLTDPDVSTVYVLANLKWAGAFATLYAFGLAWPRGDRLGWIISALMLLFVLVGVLGIAVPGLIPLRGIFFLAGMPLFAWHFWRQSQRVKRDA